MRLGGGSLIRCRDVGVCPALSAGRLASVVLHEGFPSSNSLASRCATRAGASEATVRALFCGTFDRHDLQQRSVLRAASSGGQCI
jgi:hypothetical protein